MKRLVHLFVSALLIAATVLSLSSCTIKLWRLKHAVSFLYDCKTCCDEGEIECSTCEGEKVTECSICNGTGERNCPQCYGLGHRRCSMCGGSGYRFNGGIYGVPMDCFSCVGGYEFCVPTVTCGCSDGKRACADCGAEGFVDCPDCEQ